MFELRGIVLIENTKNVSKTQDKTGKTCGTSNGMQKDGQAASQSHKSDGRAEEWQWKRVENDVWLYVESHESTRQWPESLESKIHEDRIARKGFTSMTHYNLVHKFIPMPQEMKVPDAKAAVDKTWKKLETIPGWNLEKVNGKKEVILEAQGDNKKVHFASLMYTCHLQNAELQPLQKYKGRVMVGRAL